MQFRKYITKQSNRQSYQSTNNQDIKPQRKINAQEQTHVTQKHVLHSKDFTDGSNQLGNKHKKQTLERERDKETRLEPSQERKEHNGLTDEQRKIVGDIGKLFSSEASKPTKLLIRLNQTQSSKINKGGQKGSLGQNRLEKIQVTRIDNHNVQAALSKKTHEVNFNERQKQNDRESQTEPQLSSSLRSAKSSIRICHSSQSILDPPPSKMCLAKQISIMYVPVYSQVSYKSPNYFSKFNKKNYESKLQSINSNYSNDFNDEKDSRKDNPQGSNYVKLLEVELFLRKQEIRHQRSQQLRHANQKLLSMHLFSKEQLQKAKAHIQKIQLQYKSKVEQLNAQLEQQKKQSKQLETELQLKQKSLQSLNKLNEQYLKQNNDLKQTIKDNMKSIRELKYQITNKQKVPPIDVSKNQADSKHNKKISFLKSQNQYGQIVPRSPRRQTRHNQQQIVTNNDNITSYTPTQIIQKSPYQFYRNDKVQVKQARLANCRSQGILNQAEAIKRENLIKDNMHHHYQPTSRSHKNVGIRKNNFNQEPISPSTRNLVRINKNSINDGSILIGEKIKDNKSLSNFSQLSGKSLSQRVGYFPKPSVQDKKSGVLVDYMIDSEVKPRQQQRVQKKLQRFKFK